MKNIGANPAAANAEVTAIASGALVNGDAVIVNSDGTAVSSTKLLVKG